MAPSRTFLGWRAVDVAEFDYVLPAERIAQHALDQRDAARLLVDRGPHQPPADRHVYDLPRLLEPGDVVVANRTRVRPARLAMRKPTGGAIEVLLLEQNADGTWRALVRGSRRVAAGTRLVSERGDDLSVELLDGPGAEQRLVRVHTARDVDDLLAVHGRVPLPPYITAELDDPDRYQTVFADMPGSVAAPTAGLHLTDHVIHQCTERGIEVELVELVVGLDTFRPMTVDKVEDHVMHGERYRIPERTWRRVRDAKRVVAIGTTTLRALESAALTGALEGRTELFVHRGFRFSVVDVLMTNFHLPRSTLLVLVDAFVGPRWRDLYQHALDNGYRFLSFGDAMLLARA